MDLLKLIKESEYFSTSNDSIDIGAMTTMPTGLCSLKGTDYFLSLHDIENEKIKVLKRTMIKDSRLYAPLIKRGLPETTYCLEAIDVEDFIDVLRELELDDVIISMIYNFEKF